MNERQLFQYYSMNKYIESTKNSNFGYTNNNNFDEKDHSSLIKQDSSESYVNIERYPINIDDNVDVNDKKSNAPKSKNDKQIRHRRHTNSRIQRILREKNYSQQVSCLYSEYIYKSMQKGHLHDNQLEKCKNILENQRREKMKLLAAQNQWKIERNKLLEQREVMLFALNSLSVNISPKLHNVKSKQVLIQTTLGVQSGRYGDNKSKQINTMIREKKPKTSRLEKKSIIRESIKQNKVIHEEGDKINVIKDIKQNIDVVDLCQNKRQHQKKYMEAMLKQRQQEMMRANLHIEQLKSQINKLKKSNEEHHDKESQLFVKVDHLENQKKNTVIELEQEKIKNKELTDKIQEVETLLKTVEEDKKAVLVMNKQLQRQLEITHEQYQSKEQRERQCVRILQKFTKQLKLNDTKIQQFLNSEQMISYRDKNSEDLQTSKKTYQEHLSYILHLCKKKQSVYENIVEEFKEKMKESDFKSSLLEKKVNTYTQHQRQLRDLVYKQANAHCFYTTILQFGY